MGTKVAYRTRWTDCRIVKLLSVEKDGPWPESLYPGGKGAPKKVGEFVVTVVVLVEVEIG